MPDFTNNPKNEDTALDYFTSSILGEAAPTPRKEEPEHEHEEPGDTGPSADDEPGSPSAGPSSESDDGDGDPGGQEDEPTQEPERPSLVWSIEDQEVEITEDGDYLRIPKEAAEKLKGGYLRTQDYTKKTTELSEARKQELARVQEKEQEALKLLDTALVHAQANLAPYAEVDFNKLERDDPYEADRLRSEYLKEAQKYQEIEAQHQQLAQQSVQRQKEQLKEWADQEKERVQMVIPQLADESTAKEYATSIVNYGKEVGFQEQELGSLVDHRHILVLDKARKYDELMAKREASKKPSRKKSSPSVKPGSGERPPATPKAQQRQKEMRERWQKGQSTDALAVDAFASIISKEQEQ